MESPPSPSLAVYGAEHCAGFLEIRGLTSDQKLPLLEGLLKDIPKGAAATKGPSRLVVLGGGLDAFTAAAAAVAAANEGPAGAVDEVGMPKLPARGRGPGELYSILVEGARSLTRALAAFKSLLISSPGRLRPRPNRRGFRLGGGLSREAIPP